MKRHIDFIAAILVLSSSLAMGSNTVMAATSTETTLTVQAQQMDALTTNNGEVTVSDKISSEFDTFAGSTDNSDALVSGLRNGTPVTLTTTDAQGVTTTTTFTPPTGKMGFGNVFISLAIAKQQLTNLGITQPTARQLQAALTGGTVVSSTGESVTLAGVLQMRAQGMGWGQIANSLGFKLGPVVSGIKAANAHIASQATVKEGGVTHAVSNSSRAETDTDSKSGIVTATGKHIGASSAGNHAASHSESGIVTVSGKHLGGSGSDVAADNGVGSGIVTGTGRSAGGWEGGSGNGNSHGQGIVTAAGGHAGTVAAGGSGHGKALGRGN